MNASILRVPGGFSPGVGKGPATVMSFALYMVAIGGGIMLVTGPAKWVLARAWPGVFGKRAHRKGRHRGRSSRPSRY